ncbi:MAG: helix-turn-helix domain-containing protein [Bacteroidales bacterium]|nr:helix-turn-helix domain-containing protein [Bacteroidales bacterium]
MHQSHTVWKVGFVFINGAIPAYLIGPLLYLYVRGSITDSSALKKSDIIHLIPVLLYIIASSRYIITPWPVKEEFAIQIIQDRRFIWFISSNIVNWLIPNEVNFISRPGLILFYSILSLIKLMRYRNRKEYVLVFRKYNLNYKWLFSLLVFVILLTLSNTILIIISILNRDINFYTSMNTLQVVGAIGFLGIVLLPFLYPSVLYGLPHFKLPEHVKGQIIHEISAKYTEKQNNIKHEEKQYPEFEPHYLQYIDETVENKMLHEKPFLQKDCNLPFLARILVIPAHHLSYYFREVKKQSFNDYKNAWRVKHAKELIEKNKHKGLTMEAVGTESGFSSKNAFFTAFKKFENMTPGQFAENISDG